MKKRLGKGILALVDEVELDVVRQGKLGGIELIDIEKVIPNRYQPRKHFPEETLNDLANSIREKGVIQPIIVSRLGDGRYELVAGERRLRAAKLAGLTEIPSIIGDYSEEDRLEIALVENIQREDLNAIEIAEAYQEIIKRMELSQEELAQKIGKSRSAVTNTLRLLKLPEYVRSMIRAGELTEGHARAILMLDNLDSMIEFAKSIIKRRLSVRQAEAEAPEWKNRLTEQVSRETIPSSNNEIKNLEEQLIHSLGAKVQILGNLQRGKIQIFYHSRDELENLFRLISQNVV